MNCTKCGKEIPDGENEVCEECKNKVLEEIKKEEEEVKTEKAKDSKADKKEENKKKSSSKKKDKKSEAKVDNKKTNKSEEKKNKKTDKKENEKGNSKNKNLIIASTIIGVIVLLLVALLVYFFVVPKSGKMPNTIGNIRNLGYSTVQGNWIYYVAPNEDSTQIGIFKVKTNGEDKKQIYMGDLNIVSMNVKGDYLYFIGIGPEVYNENDESDNKIYRIKTDGKDLEIINDNEFHNACYEIYVINNSIYYIGTDQNIYKMKLDGTNRELVSDNGTGYLGITNKHIIYNVDETGNANEYVTYIMNLDGSNPKQLIEGKRLYSIDVKDDYVYYTNADKEIYRTKIGSNEEEKLYELTAYNLNLNGDYLYYLNYEEGTDKICIYRVKADGTSSEPQKIKTMDSYSEFINVVDDWVYYMDYNDESGFINMVKTDGSEEVVQLYLLVYSDFYESLNTADTNENTEVDNNTDTTNTQEQDLSGTNAENVVDTNAQEPNNVQDNTNTAQ